MNILIPMAGEGSRFKNEGYEDPKPFIEFDGLTMIEHVVDSLCHNLNKYGIVDKFIFICRIEHKEQLEHVLNSYEEYGCDDNGFAKLINIDYDIITVDHLTDGAACTALLAKDIINSDIDLLLTDCDHIINDTNYLGQLQDRVGHLKADAALLCHLNDHQKWSYCRYNSGVVSEVVEKQVISNLANTGDYYYKKGKYFVQAAEKMIQKNDRSKGEFFLAPSMNYLIADGKQVIIHMINEMHGLGTPEDLNKYIEYSK